MPKGKLRSAIAIAGSLALAAGLSAPAQAVTNAVVTKESSTTYTVDAPSPEDLIQAKKSY